MLPIRPQLIVVAITAIVVVIVVVVVVVAYIYIYIYICGKYKYRDFHDRQTRAPAWLLEQSSKILQVYHR